MYDSLENNAHEKVGDTRKFKGYRPTPFLIAEQEALQTGQPLFTMGSLRNPDGNSKNEIRDN